MEMTQLREIGFENSIHNQVCEACCIKIFAAVNLQCLLVDRHTDCLTMTVTLLLIQCVLLIWQVLLHSGIVRDPFL